ncbi:hypothetical protein B5S28_g2029 [[Candida] boidinii]|uniref:Unnamed protein product n=1 Tax=Candida boidinii TaxID=5477 RepID=A0ACB5TFD9_CANBO|nr:hypothetical protein B5S28_g2029 [[Candida] boidinii]GME87421.1 unnamed protein product [[Candida] boidinii]
MMSEGNSNQNIADSSDPNSNSNSNGKDEALATSSSSPDITGTNAAPNTHTNIFRDNYIGHINSTAASNNDLSSTFKIPKIPKLVNTPSQTNVNTSSDLTDNQRAKLQLKLNLQTLSSTPVLLSPKGSPSASPVTTGIFSGEQLRQIRSDLSRRNSLANELMLNNINNVSPGGVSESGSVYSMTPVDHLLTTQQQQQQQHQQLSTSSSNHLLSPEVASALKTPLGPSSPNSTLQWNINSNNNGNNNNAPLLSPRSHASSSITPTNAGGTVISPNIQSVEYFSHKVTTPSQSSSNNLHNSSQPLKTPDYTKPISNAASTNSMSNPIMNSNTSATTATTPTAAPATTSTSVLKTPTAQITNNASRITSPPLNSTQSTNNLQQSAQSKRSPVYSGVVPGVSASSSISSNSSNPNTTKLSSLDSRASTVSTSSEGISSLTPVSSTASVSSSHPLLKLQHSTHPSLTQRPSSRTVNGYAKLRSSNNIRSASNGSMNNDKDNADDSNDDKIKSTKSSSNSLKDNFEKLSINNPSKSFILKNNLNSNYNQQYLQQESVYLNGLTRFKNKYRNNDDYYNKSVNIDEEDLTDTATEDYDIANEMIIPEEMDDDMLRISKEETLIMERQKEVQALYAIGEKIGMKNDGLQKTEYSLDPNFLLDILENSDEINLRSLKSDNEQVFERLEWQSMLQSVLTGDVVTGEKTKLIKPLTEVEGENYLRASHIEDLWIGIRSRLYGRSEEDQKRLVLYHRGLVDETIDEIMNFKLEMPDDVIELSYAEQVKSASEKVDVLLDKWEKCQELWRTQKEMITDKPRCGTVNFNARISALTAWTSVAAAIERESDVLKKWVGNDKLDILGSPSNYTNNYTNNNVNKVNSKTPVDIKNEKTDNEDGSSNKVDNIASVIADPPPADVSTPIEESSKNNDTVSVENKKKNHKHSVSDDGDIEITRRKPEHFLKDDRSFVERILKEKDIEDLFQKRLFAGISHWTFKAKESFLVYHDNFEELGLPSYVDNLLVLVTFPTKLMKELIRIRLGYAKKLKNPTMMMIDQVLEDFKLYIKLSLEIRTSLIEYCTPRDAWISFPDYRDAAFDDALLDCVHHYLFYLNRKLLDSPKATKSFRTFKEPEELEKQWEFLQNVGFYIEGGSNEISQQFTTLTSKLVSRLNNYLVQQFQGPPYDGTPLDQSKLFRWYTSTMENFGQLRRKFYRFSLLLNQYFQNCLLFNLNGNKFKYFLEMLKESNHTLYHSQELSDEGIYIFVPEVLASRPSKVFRFLNGSNLCVDNSKIPRRHLEVMTNYNSFVETMNSGLVDLNNFNNYYNDNMNEIEMEANNRNNDNSNERLGELLEYVLVVYPSKAMVWDGKVVESDINSLPVGNIDKGKVLLISAGGAQNNVDMCGSWFKECVGDTIGSFVSKRCSLVQVQYELTNTQKIFFRISSAILEGATSIRNQCRSVPNCQELVNNCFIYIRDFGKDCVRNFDPYRRSIMILKLTQLAIEWLGFIVDDCVPTEPKTFRWCVAALEFAMDITRSFNILTLDSDSFYRLKDKVAGCMSLLISHFDIMGARTKELQKKRMETNRPKKDLYTLDDESIGSLRAHIMQQVTKLEEDRRILQVEQQAVGRVLDDTDTANQFLTYLASSFSSVSIRWQKGKFLGGGTFGSVYASLNLDTGGAMAVKEIRFQDSQSIKTVVPAIKGEMTVLEMLSHPNIVQFFGVEVHRDRVYIFMEYCSGGSLAGLLEYGRIEDETVIQLYTLQLLEGLAYLHQFGIVHRDIKPENILLDHMGVIKLVDFGSAKVIAMAGRTKDSTIHQGRKTQALTGTPMYMSPETIRGEPSAMHGAIDIWSLGCCVLETATGRRPWANLDNEYAVMYHIASGHLPQFPSSEQLSPLGLEFLAKCLVTDPNKRSTAVELLQDPWIQMIRNEAFSDPNNGSQVDLSMDNSATNTNASSSTLSSVGINSGASGTNGTPVAGSSTSTSSHTVGSS